MVRTLFRRGGTLAAVLVALPGLASAQTIDASLIASQSIPVRAAGAFVLALLFGSGMWYLFEDFVEHSFAQAVEQPLNSVLYGFFAQGGVIFLGAYARSQLAQFGSIELISIANLILGISLLVLAGIGLTVVGMRLTALVGERQPWRGVLIGAVLGALPWLAPSLLVATVVWIALVAVGVGGSTRTWLHSSRDVSAETS
jgi:hypothetical protein